MTFKRASLKGRSIKQNNPSSPILGFKLDKALPCLWFPRVGGLSELLEAAVDSSGGLLGVNISGSSLKDLTMMYKKTMSLLCSNPKVRRCVSDHQPPLGSLPVSLVHWAAPGGLRMPVSHAGPPADCPSHHSLFPGLCFLKEWLCVPCQKDQKVKKDLTIGTVERRTLKQPRRVESISCHPFSSGHALNRWRVWTQVVAWRSAAWQCWNVVCTIFIHNADFFNVYPAFGILKMIFLIFNNFF